MDATSNQSSVEYAGVGAGAVQSSVDAAFAHSYQDVGAGVNQPSVAESGRHVSVFHVVDDGAIQPSVLDAVCTIGQVQTHHPKAAAIACCSMSRLR